MYEIIPNLYLSNFSEALDASKTSTFYQINVTKELPMFDINPDMNMRIAINDDMTEAAFEGFLDALPETMQKIDEKILSGTMVVVHCSAGQQRSAAVICAYLLYKRITRTLSDTIYYIRNKKKDAFFFTINFLQPLQKWQHQLEHKEKNDI